MAKSATEVRKKFAEENMYCEIYEPRKWLYFHRN